MEGGTARRLAAGFLFARRKSSSRAPARDWNAGRGRGVRLGRPQTMTAELAFAAALQHAAGA